MNANVEFIAEESGVAEYRLKNGLKVLLVENNTAPVITLLVLYKVGSRNEAVGYTGATHFLEHMLFKGTKEHNPEHGNGIDDLLTQIGAYWNATTWFDRTSYYEVVPNEYMELCIKLEADRMRNLLLRRKTTIRRCRWCATNLNEAKTFLKTPGERTICGGFP